MVVVAVGLRGAVVAEGKERAGETGGPETACRLAEELSGGGGGGFIVRKGGWRRADGTVRLQKERVA